MTFCIAHSKILSAVLMAVGVVLLPSLLSVDEPPAGAASGEASGVGSELADGAIAASCWGDGTFVCTWG